MIEEYVDAEIEQWRRENAKKCREIIRDAVKVRINSWYNNTRMYFKDLTEVHYKLCKDCGELVICRVRDARGGDRYTRRKWGKFIEQRHYNPMGETDYSSL
nr:hypothetical protein K-LCC10_0285 [Kaumoebavirus]